MAVFAVMWVLSGIGAYLLTHAAFSTKDPSWGKFYDQGDVRLMIIVTPWGFIALVVATLYFIICLHHAQLQQDKP